MILAAVVASFSFGGGSGADLAGALADWSGLPTVVLVQDARRIGTFGLQQTTVEDGKRFERLLPIKADLKASARGGKIAVWDAAWAPRSVSYGMSDSPLPTGLVALKPEESWVRGGRVTLRAGAKEAIRVKELEKLSWSKPLRVHWFIERLWIAPVAKGADESTFLGAVADAVGGRFERGKTDWRIEFDAPRFRPRALATIAHRVPRGDTPALARSSVEVAQTAWRDVPDSGINELFTKPNQMGGWMKMTETNKGMAVRRYTALKEFVDFPQPGLEQVAEVFDSQLRSIDLAKTIYIGLSQSITATIGWSRVGGGMILL